MEIKKHELRDEDTNIEFHSKSDGVFMPKELALNAHRSLPRIHWALDMITKNSWETVLDVGCKDGYLALTAARMDKEAVGIDPAIDAIEEAKNRAKKIPDKKVSFDAVRIEDYITDKHFDAVVLLDVLDRILDPKAVMKKCKKLGDNLLIALPCYYGRLGFDDENRNTDRIRVYKEPELKDDIKKWGLAIKKEFIVDGEFLMWLK